MPKLQLDPPCTAQWDAMAPASEGRRFCADCQKCVHDLTALPERDAEAFLAAHEDRDVCVRVPSAWTVLKAAVALTAGLATGCEDPPPPPVVFPHTEPLDTAGEEHCTAPDEPGYDAGTMDRPSQWTTEKLHYRHMMGTLTKKRTTTVFQNIPGMTGYIPEPDGGGKGK